MLRTAGLGIRTESDAGEEGRRAACMSVTSRGLRLDTSISRASLVRFPSEPDPHQRPKLVGVALEKELLEVVIAVPQVTEFRLEGKVAGANSSADAGHKPEGVPAQIRWFVASRKKACQVTESTNMT